MPDDAPLPDQPSPGGMLPDETLQDEDPFDPVPDRGLEQLASGLIGGVSGGLLGLILAGFAGSKLGPGPASMTLTVILTIGVGVLVAVVNVRSKPPALPVAPRAVWGVLFTGAAVVIVIAVFLLETTYVVAASSSGQTVKPPLAIWPVCRAVLTASLLSLVCGFVAALAGWSQLSQNREKYTGSKWVALSIMASGAWMVLTLACYIAGHGFSLVL